MRLVILTTHTTHTTYTAGYKYELALVLNGTTPFPDFSSLEHKIFQPFRHPPPPLPSSTSPPSSPLPKRAKCHFNYLLLDPRKAQGVKAGGCSDLDVFRRFVESVFYIGKGKNARSLQHLKDAKECLTQVRKQVRRLIQSQDIRIYFFLSSWFSNPPSCDTSWISGQQGMVLSPSTCSTTLRLRRPSQERPA